MLLAIYARAAQVGYAAIRPEAFNAKGSMKGLLDGRSLPRNPSARWDRIYRIYMG